MSQAGSRDYKDPFDARNPGVKRYGKYGSTDSDLEREERERRARPNLQVGGKAGRGGDLNRPVDNRSSNNNAGMMLGQARYDRRRAEGTLQQMPRLIKSELQPLRTIRRKRLPKYPEPK